jgi:hypothetical protein
VRAFAFILPGMQAISSASGLFCTNALRSTIHEGQVSMASTQSGRLWSKWDERGRRPPCIEWQACTNTK